MIPPREELEALYDSRELDKFDEVRGHLNTIQDDGERARYGNRILEAMWPYLDERIQKTHWIATKDVGVVTLFKWNRAQRRFYERIREVEKQKRPVRVIVLKARQLGFSTWVQSYQWAQCAMHPNRNALTVSFDDVSTIEMFQKVQLIRRRLWFPPEAQRDRGELIELKSGSTFHLRTAGNKSAGRSQTIHSLHLSECAMWDNADEVLTSLLQAVPSKPGTFVVYESTAQGAVGSFYEKWRAAERGESDDIAFFAPWHEDPEYRLEFATSDERNRFGRSLDHSESVLADRHGLTLEQLAWRRWKIRNDCGGSIPKFKQEFPSTASEAFLSTGAAVFDPDAVDALERECHPAAWIGEIELSK